MDHHSNIEYSLRNLCLSLSLSHLDHLLSNFKSQVYHWTVLYVAHDSSRLNLNWRRHRFESDLKSKNLTVNQPHQVVFLYQGSASDRLWGSWCTVPSWSSTHHTVLYGWASSKLRYCTCLGPGWPRPVRNLLRFFVQTRGLVWKT